MSQHYSSLTELFVHIVQKHPERIAIKDATRTLTYRDLYNHALRVSEILLGGNIGKGDRIVCISKKNAESLVCFWGTLLCGAIPVMLDHFDGEKPNEAKMREVRPAAIIADRNFQTPGPRTDAIVLFAFEDLIHFDEIFLSDIYVTPPPFQEVCYILLTSGTTGNPKAVQISHGNVLHYTYSIYEKIGSPQAVNAVHASTFAADLGLTNLLVALMSGGMLRILDKTESTDPGIFNAIIEEDKISLLKITPSHLLALITDISRPYSTPIRSIILGGEKLSWETVKKIFSLGICSSLYNHYGPTETTIGAIAYPIDPYSPHFNVTGSVPLGAPMGRGQCFLHNPIESIGELCIAGPGVSIGYFENETENDRKFFMGTVKGEKIRCYRTGDICRKLDDGNYEFLYRTDRQVKIKGYRIELGEIELALALHPSIEGVMVAVSPGQERNVLEAYIKPLKGQTLTPEIIRPWLAERLPNYKIPSYFHFYTKAPYNSNGKIDMDALRASFGKKSSPAIPEMAEEGMRSWPESATRCWKAILNKDRILGSDHFFETGGDSLLAMQLVGRLQRLGFKVHITDLNNHPVFDDFIRVEPGMVVEERKGQAEKDLSRFTFSQTAFLQQDKYNLNNYCQTILLEADTKIMVREMALALNCVVASHLQLHAVFKKGEKNTFVDNEYGRGLYLGTSILDNGKSVAVQIQEISHNLLYEISLDKGNLFVAHVFVDPIGKDYIYLACHHLVTDVISWHIIIDEFMDYYDQAIKGDRPSIQPENMVNHFLDQLSLRENDTDFFNNVTLPKIYRLPLPDGGRNSPAGIEVAQLLIPDEIASILRNADEPAEPSAISSLLLSAFGKAILKEYALPQISIDLEFHGRPQQEGMPDLSRSVAWWATTMPVTLDRERSEARDCSAMIGERTLQANRLNLCKPNTFPTLETADIRFNYLGAFPEKFSNPAIQLRPSCFNPGPTRSSNAQKEYKLYFTARFIGERLVIDIQYQRDCFSRDYMDKLLTSFFDFLALQLKIGKPVSSSFRPLILESNIPSVGQPLYNLDPAGGSTGMRKRSIFLTGATGFLGIHLLQELSREPQTEVYCLVRGESEMHAVYRLESCFQYYFKGLSKDRWKRIKVVKGDLLSHQLGISKTDYDNIARDADLIIHAAADTNLMKDYASLIQTNTVPIKNLIDLAATGKQKQIHYVSTLAVSGRSPGGDDTSFSEDDFEMQQFFISDYERSKFEGEKMIRAFFANGGEGKIYRVGHIAADSLQGKFQKNIGQNRIFQVMAGLSLLRQIPNVFHERVAFSYVDIVARGIANFCLDRTITAMRCIHMENPQSFSFIKIASMMNQIGYDIEMVSMDVFKNSVAGFTGTQHEKGVVELTDNWVRRYLDFPRRVNYVQRNSLDVLAQSGLYFPRTTMEWFSGMIRKGIEAGYFQSPSSVQPVSPLLLDAELF